MSSNIIIPGKQTASYLADEIKELKEQILADQARWLDETMRKLLTKEERDKLTGDSIGDEEKRQIFEKHGLVLQNIPDVFGLRMLKHGKCVAEFKAQFVDEQDNRKVYTVEPDTGPEFEGAIVPKRTETVHLKS